VKTAQKDARRWLAMGPILACGDTNAAVDNLLEGLLDKGLRVMRLGQPAKASPASFEWRTRPHALKEPECLLGSHKHVLRFCWHSAQVC
jgi:hypothetical protein